MLNTRIPCHSRNQSQKSRTSPPLRREKSSTRERRRTMTQGIKSSLKKAFHQATGCVFQTRRKGKIAQLTRNLYQQIVPPDAVKALGASTWIPVSPRTSLQPKGCHRQQIGLLIQSRKVQWTAKPPHTQQQPELRKSSRIKAKTKHLIEEFVNNLMKANQQSQQSFTSASYRKKKLRANRTGSRTEQTVWK